MRLHCSHVFPIETTTAIIPATLSVSREVVRCNVLKWPLIEKASGDPETSQTETGARAQLIMQYSLAMISTVRGWSGVTARHHDALTPVTRRSSRGGCGGVSATVDRHSVDTSQRTPTGTGECVSWG